MKNNAALNINTVYQVDPTRTTVLRSRFVADVTRRFKRVMRLVQESVVANDCFGLKDEAPRLFVAQAASPGQFAFSRSSAKVDGFMDWLNIQEEQNILEIIRRPGSIRGIEEAWTDTYTQSAYQKGIQRADAELKKAGVPVLDVDQLGQKMPLSVLMNQSMHADRVGLLYTRTFNELKGISTAMDQQISRVLSQWLIDGRGLVDKGGLNELSNILIGRIDKIGLTRAKMMARTEIIRAHHSANIAEYRRAGLEGVKVKAEFSTAGYNVCEECASLEGRIFTLDEIENLIPVHPNCLVDGQVKVYTSDGWKQIRDIKVNDLVLTHKGRFKKVTQLHRNVDQPDIVRMFLAGKSNQQMSLSVTDLHPVLVNGKWVHAKDILKGDIVSFLADEGKLDFVDLQVQSTKKWRSPRRLKLYNLSVECDESYIANGFVVHNCRCVALPWIPEVDRRN